MSQHPTWFGPAERPLFGWLHVPEGGLARGAVVCCPPLGVEAVAAHRALRELALSLEAAGYAVLRFDYAGTGDSAGAGLGVADWVQSIRVAVEYVRDCGLSRVGLVGMRLGATLAAEVAGTVDAAVFWDPCSSGRAFIREHQLLREASVGGQVLPRTDAADGSVEILGSVFSAPVVAGLRGLDFGRSVRAAAAARTLVLTRPEQAIPEPWRQALPSAQWGLARGQGELLDVTADLAQLPTATAGLIRWWLERTLDGPLETVTPLLRRSAELTLEGRVVVEELVEVGPTGLFGVLARPAQGEPAGSVLVFTNAGLIDHTGPARLWVERGRSYASVGIPTLRLDLSGLGDSPTHPAQRRDIPHPYEALQDLADTAESLPQLLGTPADLVLAGLCSGAYHAIEGALAGHAQGVIALNPLLGFEPPRPNTEVRLEAAVPLRPWADRLRRIDALARFAEYRLPPLIWWLLDVLRIQRHQAHGLQQLAERAVPTLVLCGDAEARPFLRRAKGVMRRLRRGGIVQFELLPSIDHTLYGAEARQRTVARLDAYVLSRYAAPPDSSALSYRTIVDASDERPGRLPRPRAAAVAELPVSSRFALVALIGLFGLAQQYLGQLLGEAGALGAAQALFVVGLVLIFVPSVWRMLGRGVPRRERLGIALLLTMLLAASNLLLGARPFTGFDEVEHQVTLWQLGHGHTLSGVGAHAGHPGVELAALAGHWLAGVPVGVSAVVATVAGRLLLVLMVFLLVERALGSSRAASIAVVACLATPQFYAFNAPHTVATIGLTFAVGVIYLTARAAATPGLRWGLIALSAAALAGLVLCSALVSVVTVGGLVLVAAALLVLRRAAARAVGAVALLGMALLGGWTALVVTHLQPGTPDSLRQRISTQLFGAAVPAAFRGPADRSAPGWQQLAVPGAALAVVVLLLVNRRLRARVRPVALLLLAVAAFGVTTVVSVGPDWSFTPGHQPAATAARAVDPGGIAAAAWVAQTAPRGTAVAADPADAALLAGIGRADVPGRTAQLLAAGAWGPADTALVRRDGLRLLVLDTRAVAATPAKLAAVTGVVEVYVDGPLHIYDLSRLTGRTPLVTGVQRGPLPVVAKALNSLTGWDWELNLLAAATLALWVRRPRRLVREPDGAVDNVLAGAALAIVGAAGFVASRLPSRQLALGLLAGLAGAALLARWLGRGRGGEVDDAPVPEPASDVPPARSSSAAPPVVRARSATRARIATLLGGTGLLGRFVYLLATQFFVVGFGIGYWIVTAKLVPAQSVGLAAAAVSAATFLSALSVVGVGSLVLVELVGVTNSERRVLLGTGVAVAGLVTAALAGLLWLGAWAALPHLGGSFGRLIHDPAAASLMIIGAVATTIGGIYDAASISLRLSRVQLLRNIVMAALRVGLVVALVAVGVTSATGLLVAWAGSMAVSLLFCPGRLTPRFGGDRLTLPAGREMVTRFAISALRHHSLNLAITSVAFFLPLLAAVLLVPRDYAYFAVAQLISSTVMLVPAALTLSLFAETIGDEALLRRHIRRTLPVGLGCSAFALLVLEPSAGLVLRVFGPEYATHGATTLRLLLLGGLSYVVKDHYVAIRRAQGRLSNAARTVAVATLGEAALTALGGGLYGVDGLCAFWVGATVLEALYFAPVVLRVVRSPKQAPRRLATSQLVSA